MALRQVTLAGAGRTEKTGHLSWRAMNAPAARSKTRLRFIFLLKAKSKLSRVLCESRNWACLVRRSSQALATQGEFRRRPGTTAGRWGERFGLGLTADGSPARRGHSAQAKVVESTVRVRLDHSSISLVFVVDEVRGTAPARGSMDRPCCKLSGAWGQRSR